MSDPNTNKLEEKDKITPWRYFIRHSGGAINLRIDLVLIVDPQGWRLVYLGTN